MKILIVNRALGTLFGGGESFDLNAAAHLAKRGHDVTVVTGRPLLRPANNRFAGVRVEYVRCPDLRRFAYATECVHSQVSAAFYHSDEAIFEWMTARWLKARRRRPFDIVQCCSLFGLPRHLLTKFGTPVVSWLPGRPSGMTRRRLPALLSHPKFGLFTHGDTERLLKDMGLTRDRDYAIIEPGIDLELIDATPKERRLMRGKLNLNENALLGITTARLVPFKNHQLLLRGLANARARGADWHWALIGDGPLETKLKLAARRLGISSQVHFLGYRPQVEVHRWLRATDIFALTSDYETFSIATLEAIAHGLPVIGTQAGYLQQLILAAQAGVVIPSGSPEAVADALVDMARPASRARINHNRALVERLDWPLIAEKLERFYVEVIAGRFRPTDTSARSR
jgi:glycosyltransferase involved in cell wall biosynthesis